MSKNKGNSGAPRRAKASRAPTAADHLGELVANAIDFLTLATEEFESRLKHSVIAFYTAVELMLKARLMAEHTERVRNMDVSQPVLHWIRSCFDPTRNPCFREIYVPPVRPRLASKAANDVAPPGTSFGRLAPGR